MYSLQGPMPKAFEKKQDKDVNENYIRKLYFDMEFKGKHSFPFLHN